MKDQLFKLVESLACLLSHPYTFGLIAGLYLAWVLSAIVMLPLGAFTVWQLIMDIPSTAIGLVLLIALTISQDRDNKALHTKIDALIAALDAADDRVKNLEKKTVEEVEKLHEEL